MRDLRLHRLDQEQRGIGHDRVSMEEPLAQAHRAEGQADPLVHLAATALHPFGTAAPDIEDEGILAAPVGIGRDAREYRFRLLVAGEQAHGEAEHRLGLLEKGAAVAAIPHRAGGHGIEPLHAEFGRLGAKIAQGDQGPLDGFRAKFARIDEMLRQPGADALLPQNAHATRPHFRDDELDRVAAQVENGVTHGASFHGVAGLSTISPLRPGRCQ